MDSHDGFNSLTVGSMPKNFSYVEEDEALTVAINEVKPRILLMGLRRSGKSSIQKVSLIFTLNCLSYFKIAYY